MDSGARTRKISRCFPNAADARAVAAFNALKAEAEDGKCTLLESLYGIFRISGCLSRWLSSGTSSDDDMLSRAARLTVLTRKYEQHFSRPSAKNLLWLLHNRTMEAGDDGGRVDAGEAVKCMTVHKAKGLEFPAVVICSLLEGDFPLRYRSHDNICGVPIPKELMKTSGADEDSHFAEELRLFYVAMTRAQDLLILCVPEKINVRKASPSRFLKMIEPYVTGRVGSDVKMETRYAAPRMDISMSYSAAHAYRECPFRYKLLYEYGFAAPEDTNQKHGVIVHNVLQKVNWAIQNGADRGESAIRKMIDDSWVTIRGARADVKMKDNYVKNTLTYAEFAQRHFDAVESFEKTFTYIDGGLIIRGKTDLVARDKSGRRLLVDFKARTIKGIEETGVEDQLRIYRRCLKDSRIERIGTYTFFDSQFREFRPDDEAAGRMLAEVSAGIAAGSFPACAPDKVCQTCHFSFICKGMTHA